MSLILNANRAALSRALVEECKAMIGRGMSEFNRVVMSPAQLASWEEQATIVEIVPAGGVDMPLPGFIGTFSGQPLELDPRLRGDKIVFMCDDTVVAEIVNLSIPQGFAA